MSHTEPPDYPAAHSMDTWWFAVDERGQVAVFDTEENGPIPAGGSRAEWAMIEDVLPSARTSLEERYARCGVAYYEYDDDYGGLVRLYQRARELTVAPLHVDQLPLAVRRACRGVCFSGVRFDRIQAVQPLEFFACQRYSEGAQVAYLAGDGVTVRPVVGHEDEYADFVAAYSERNPERAAKLRFDGKTG